MIVTEDSVVEAESTCCESSKPKTASEVPAQRIAQIFKALGDPTRVTLLSLIAQSPGGQACICDLTDPVGLTQPTVSHHMKQLSDVGLVTREKRGKWAYFRVVPTAVDDLTQALGMVLPRQISIP